MTAIQENTAAQATARYRAAAEAHDVEGVIATLSPDVVLHSPITNRLVFRGHEELRHVLTAAFATITEIDYFADVGDDRTRVLFFRGRLARQTVEEATRVEFDDDGLIREMTLFFRPLPGVAALAAAMAPRVVEQRRGRALALLARLAMAPIALITRVADVFIPLFA